MELQIRSPDYFLLKADNNLDLSPDKYYTYTPKTKVFRARPELNINPNLQDKTVVERSLSLKPAFN